MTPEVEGKLKSVETRYNQLMALVSDAAVQADPPVYRKHTKALAELQPLIDGFHEYQEKEAELKDTRELEAAGDAEMKAMARDEIARLEKRLAALDDEIRILLIPRDPNDEKNVQVELRAGPGGDEAALFVGDLYRMYQRFTERMGWKWEIISSSETGTGGLKEAIVSVEGKGALGWLKHESGVHRVQRVPATEASGRIHTSTAT
ncbi:MAG: PCRF domain-containing protein, partial [Acidobacteria bacterium]|nr:PCRF domain-containing protein [Acidobacteriota bacterium]